MEDQRTDQDGIKEVERVRKQVNAVWERIHALEQAVSNAASV